MNRTQINKSLMYGAVNEVLDSNAKLFAELGDLVLSHQNFKKGLAIIDQNRQVQEADNSGLTENKIQLRSKVISLTMRFSAALRAYATSQKDPELKTKAKYTASELKTSSDPILFDIGSLLRELAKPVAKELERYSIGEPELTEMDRLLNVYKMAIPQRRTASNASKVSTGNIADVFTSMDNLLKDEMDVLMTPFQFTLPDFFSTYKNARIIVNYSGRGKAKAVPAMS